jgi:hypothetical protein
LNEKYGKGFSTTDLWYFRQFYVVYSNREPKIRHKACRELICGEKPHKACGVLGDLSMAVEKKEYNQLNDLLKGPEYLPVSDGFWEKLSLFSFRLFRKGVTVPLIDTYIALLGIENNASILHRDKHF